MMDKDDPRLKAVGSSIRNTVAQMVQTLQLSYGLSVPDCYSFIRENVDAVEAAMQKEVDADAER
jgi:hypothetical protein